MHKVKDILSQKGNAVYAVGPDATMLDALVIMADLNIGVMLIMEDNKILGIFSERDCVYDLAKNRSCSLETPIRELMVSPIYFVTPEQTLDDCMTAMTVKHIRHLPVLDGDDVVGMISIGDVVRTIIGDKDERIKDLENILWVNLI
jgi:CBS domain-containing protein